MSFVKKRAAEEAEGDKGPEEARDYSVGIAAGRI